MSNPIKLRAFILGALAVMFLATTVYAAEPIIKDVPQSHWAYDAVSKLVSKGYLSINNLGEFQGNQPVDRYNLAQALGRLLDDIESGKVRVGSEDVELLRKLTNEYREELVMYYAEQQRTAATLTEAMKRISILDEKINTAIVVLEDITVRAELLQQNVTESNETQVAQTTALQNDITNLQLQLADSISRLQAEAEAIKASIRSTEESLRSETQALVSGVSVSQDQKRAALDSRTTSVEIRTTDLERRMSTEEGKSAALANQLNNQQDILSMQISNTAADLRNEIEALRRQAAQERNAAVSSLEAKLQLQSDMLKQAQDDLTLLIAQHRSELIGMINANAVADAKAAGRIDALEQGQSALQGTVNSHGTAIESLQNTQENQDEEIQALSRRFTDYQEAQNTRITGIEEYNKLQDGAFDNKLAAERNEREKAIAALDAKQAGENAALAAQLRADMQKLAEDSIARDNALQKELNSRLDVEIATRDAAVTALEKKLEQQTADLAQKVFADQLDLEGELLSRLQTELDDLNSQIVAESDARASAVQALDAKLVAENAALAKQLQADIDDVAKESAERNVALHKELTDKLTQQTSRLDAELATHASAIKELQAGLVDERNKTAADIQSLGQKQAAESATREAAIQALEKKLEQQTADLAQKVFADQLDLEGELLSRLQTELDDLNSQIVAESDARASAIQALDAKLVAENAALAKQLQADIDDVAKESAERSAALHKELTEKLTQQSNRLDEEIATRTSAIVDLQAELDAVRKITAADIQSLGQKQADEAAVREAAIKDLEKKLEQQTADLAQKVFADQLDLEGELLGRMQSELDELSKQISSEREDRTAALQSLDAKQTTANTELADQLQTAIDNVAKASTAGDEALMQQLTDGLADQSRRLDAEIANRTAAIKDLEKNIAGQTALLSSKLAEQQAQLDAERKERDAAIKELDEKHMAANTSLASQLQKQFADGLAEQSSRIDAEKAARETAVQNLEKQLEQQTADLAHKVLTDQLDLEGALLDKLQTELANQQAQIDTEREERKAAVQALDAKQAAENTQLQSNIDKLAQEGAVRYETLQKQLADGLAAQSSRLDAEIATRAATIKDLEKSLAEQSNRIDVERAAREAAVEELDKKLAAQTAQLAAEVVAKFEQMESEGQLSEQALLNKMQTELDSQSAQIAAERDVRAAADKALDAKLAEGLQQLTTRIDTLAAESMKRDQELENKQKADTEQLVNLINAEAATRQNAISSLDAKFTQQTNDLALKLATQFDALSQESAESNASILNQLQTELGKQQERITAEQVARESGLQALADEMKAADKEIETTLEERFSDTEKELNRHSESLAAQQLALMELEERFMAALKAQEEAYQQQLAALQAELEQTKQELATMQTKLLVVESRIGLSDTQLEALDRRINEKVDQYLTARYMNEAQLGQQIQELELKLQLSEEHAKKEIGKVNTMSWVKAVMATLIGVFVTPW